MRQALVRLKSRGFLAADRRGSATPATGSPPAGLHDLATGDRRIFRPPAATAQDGWVLAVFSVPEADRHLRHRLRTELSWLGFGTVGPGVWIAPRPLAEPARACSPTAGLDGYVTWFAAHGGAADRASPMSPRGGTWMRCAGSTTSSCRAARPRTGRANDVTDDRGLRRATCGCIDAVAAVPPARSGAARLAATGGLAGR